MRISDWSSDVCSSDLGDFDGDSRADVLWRNSANGYNTIWRSASSTTGLAVTALAAPWQVAGTGDFNADGKADILWRNPTSGANRSEEHTSELQSLMRISYAVFCLKKKKQKQHNRPNIPHSSKCYIHQSIHTRKEKSRT